MFDFKLCSPFGIPFTNAQTLFHVIHTSRAFLFYALIEAYVRVHNLTLVFHNLSGGGLGILHFPEYDVIEGWGRGGGGRDVLEDFE